MNLRVGSTWRLPAQKFVPLQRRRNRKWVPRRARLGSLPFIHAHHLAHATQPYTGFGPLRRQRYKILKRVPLLQLAFGGKQNPARTQVASLPYLGTLSASSLDKLDRQLQFKSLIFTLFAHVTPRLRLIT